MRFFTCSFFLWVTASAFSFPIHAQEKERLYTELQSSVDLFLQDDDTQWTAAYGIITGAAGINLRYFNSCPKTSGEKLAQIKDYENFLRIFDKKRYSFSVDAGRLGMIPLNISGGSLSYSGSVSKLNNPAFTTALTPFCHTPENAKGISITLPGKTSSCKPDSLFFSYTLPVNKKTDSKGFSGNDIKFSYACIETDSKEKQISSINSGFIWKNLLKASFSSTLISYSPDPVTASTWFREKSNFDKTGLSGAVQELSIAIPFIKNYTAFGILQTPFNDNVLWMRNDTLFQAGSFSTNVSLYTRELQPDSYQTVFFVPNQTNEKNIMQLKIIPELCIFLKDKATIKFGAGGGLYRSFENPGIKQYILERENFSAGIKYSSNCKNGAISFLISNIPLKTVPLQEKVQPLQTYSWTAYWSQKTTGGKGFKYSINTSIKLIPDYNPEKLKMEEKISLYLYPATGILKSASASLYAEEKENRIKWNTSFKTAWETNFNTFRIKWNMGIMLDIKPDE